MVKAHPYDPSGVSRARIWSRPHSVIGHAPIHGLGNFCISLIVAAIAWTLGFLAGMAFVGFMIVTLEGRRKIFVQFL